MFKAQDNKFDTDGLVSYKVLINGDEVTSKINIQSFSVYNAINKIATANLVLLDGSIAKQKFEISDQDFFIPGNEISIQMGYKMKDEIIFEGLVISQKVEASSEGTKLLIQCKSCSYAMTLARTSNIFYEATESDVLEEIVAKYKISAEIDSLSNQHTELVQYRCTDWDFMLSRAQNNGCVVVHNGKNLVIKKPDIKADIIQTLVLGDNIYTAELELDSRNQFSNYTARTWDFSEQEVVEIEAAKAIDDKSGNLSVNSLGEIHNQTSMELIHNGSLSTEQTTEWIESKKLWQELSKISGSIKVQGYHAYNPTETIKLEGMGDRFNGVHFISEVLHTMDGGSWTTDLELGLNPKWFMEQYKNISELPASALIPSISGLHIGTVTSLEGDSEGEHRIQISLPMIQNESEGVWARTLNPYAGAEFGIQFLPEIGSEVLVGFLNDDPNQAVVLGGLFSNKNVSPIPFTDDNFLKGMVSREKIKIEFDDEKIACRIETPSGKLIHLDEDEGVIKLSDENGNTIQLNKDGVSISSDKDIILKATGDIKLSGKNIEQKASMNYKAEGSSGLEMKSSATSVLKGSMVQIN